MSSLCPIGRQFFFYMGKAVNNEDLLDQMIDNEDNENDDNNIPVNTVLLLSSIDVLGMDSNTNGCMCNKHE
jgi:hypothetical protein